MYQEEIEALESRRGSIQASLEGEGPRVYKRKKKAQSLAERKQELKGLSKAFVTSGNGWSKVNPIHTLEEDSDDESATQNVPTSTDGPVSKVPQHAGASQESNSSCEIPDFGTIPTKKQTTSRPVNLMAQMRAQTQRLKQQNKANTTKNNQIPKQSTATTPATVSEMDHLAHLTNIPQQQPNKKMTISSVDKDHMSHLAQIPRQEEPKVSPYTNSNSTEVTTKITGQDPKSSDVVLKELLQIAQAQGMEAALQWAEEQVVRKGQAPRSTYRTRPVATPQPVRPTSTISTSLEDSYRKAVQQEHKFYDYFFEAAKDHVPFEYSVGEGEKRHRFLIRRPYGLADSRRQSYFAQSGGHPPSTYNKKAHVSAASSLEVVVLLNHCFVTVLIQGADRVHYRKSPTEEWKVATTDETISLGNMVQQALTAREQYVATVTSTALALQKKASTKEREISIPATGDAIHGEKTAALAQSSPSQRRQFRHFQWWLSTHVPLSSVFVWLPIFILLVWLTVSFFMGDEGFATLYSMATDGESSRDLLNVSK